MIPKHKFIENNMDMLRKLTRNGYVSPKLLQYYHIYNIYMGIKKGTQEKKREIVAKEIRQSVMTVRRAVTDMKQYVKD